MFGNEFIAGGYSPTSYQTSLNINGWDWSSIIDSKLRVVWQIKNSS